jgi:replicative DNA helicase
MDIEKVLASLIFYKKISIRDIKIYDYMFLNKDYINYISYLKSLNNENEDINGNFLSRNPNFQHMIMNKIELDNILMKFKINTLIEIFYNKAIEHIFLNKIYILKNNPSERGLLDEVDKILGDLKDFLKELNNHKNEDISSVDKYRNYMATILSNKKNNDLDNGVVGLSSGIINLDLITKGFKKGEYIIIAGRPSMGKTALSLDIIADNILKGKNILFFSIEMPHEQIIGRLLPKINRNLTLENTLYGLEYESKKEIIEEALSIIENSNLLIEDFNTYSKVTMFDIEKIALSYIDKYDNLDLVVVDYIQKISSDLKTTDENTLITDISKKIALLTKRTNSPWIVLSQLSRNLESRIDKRPQNADLRSSGSLEQDADIIIFPFRENIYIERDLREKIQKKPDNIALRESLENLISLEIENAEVIVSKNRNGALGNVNVQFHKKSASYINIGDFEVYEEIVNF